MKNTLLIYVCMRMHACICRMHASIYEKCAVNACTYSVHANACMHLLQMHAINSQVSVAPSSASLALQKSRLTDATRLILYVYMSM